MAEQLFVPLESLVEATHAEHLLLSESWNHDVFETQALGVAEALEAHIAMRACDSTSHVWELEIEGEPFHLCLDVMGQALLEPRTPAARKALPDLRTRLLVWAKDSQGATPGRFVPMLPKRPLGNLVEPYSDRERRRAFLWRRGVLGFGVGTGLAWLVALWIADSAIPTWVRVAFACGVFPLVGYVWALALWKQGRA